MAKNHLKSLVMSGPSITKGILSINDYCFIITPAIVQGRAHFKESGIGMNERKVGKDTCCHLHCLHESTKPQNAHPEGLSDGGTKRASKSSWIPHRNTWLDTKPFAIIRSKVVGQAARSQHTFAHLGVSWTWPIPHDWEPRWSKCFWDRYPASYHEHYPFTSQHAFTQ